MWLRTIVVLGAVTTTFLPSALTLILDWVADDRFFEIVSEMIPLLLVALAIETKAFNVLRPSGAMTRSQTIWTAIVAILMLIGEVVALATFAAHLRSSLLLATEVVVLSIAFWTLVAHAFVGLGEP